MGVVQQEMMLDYNFSSWYSKFKHLSIESETVLLSQQVIDYLNTDGIILPDSSAEEIADGQLSDDAEWDDSGDQPDLGEFTSQVDSAISRLGGAVFPKLNWSSPKDASWIAFGNTLKCSSSNDILLLLKSSTFISHDLSQLSELVSIRAELVLRKWTDELNPANEFRCFVRDHTLIGISQREVSTCYDHICQHQYELVREICHFYTSNLHHTFPQHSYVFDICRMQKDDILLIDFNPFTPLTDSLLFTWDQLLNDNTDTDTAQRPTFRYVSSSYNLCRPSEYRQYSYPDDVTADGAVSHFTSLTLSDLQNSPEPIEDDTEGSPVPASMVNGHTTD